MVAGARVCSGCCVLGRCRAGEGAVRGGRWIQAAGETRRLGLLPCMDTYELWRQLLGDERINPSVEGMGMWGVVEPLLGDGRVPL